MGKPSLLSNKWTGSDFYEFLKETGRESIRRRSELQDIYKNEFKTSKDPSFSSVLFALSAYGKLSTRGDVVVFNRTFTDLYLDPWPTRNQPIGVLVKRNLAKRLGEELQMDRAHVISDKHGVSIKADRQFEDGVIFCCVDGASKCIVNLTMENTGTRPVYFTYYTMLFWLRDFTLTDELNVTRANPLLLNPGETYVVQVRFQCSLLHSSRATLAFEFQRDLQSDAAFHIVRYIDAYHSEPPPPLLHANHESTVCQTCMLFYNLLVALPAPKLRALESSTVRQRKSQLWFDSRRIRITASMATKLLRCRNPYNYIKEHVRPRFHGNKETEHGIQSEALAYRWLEERGYTIRRSGTVVCENRPWLSASPDGILNTGELLEIKCPYNPLDTLMGTPRYDLQREEGRVVLKSNGARGFYNQVQLSMFCTGLRACKLLVYQKPPRESYLLDVTYDEQKCQEMVDNLNRRYFEAMLPYLSDLFQKVNLWISGSYLRFCEE